MSCGIRGIWSFDIENMKATHNWGIEIKFSKQTDQTIQAQLVGKLPARVDSSHLNEILKTTQRVMIQLDKLSDDESSGHGHEH